MALKLARECEREADDLFDQMPSLDMGNKWMAHMRAEAKRHRERAADYLRSRKWILDNMEDRNSQS